MNHDIITCPSCGTKNRVSATGRAGRPVCGSCRSPLSKYPQPYRSVHPTHPTHSRTGHVESARAPVAPGNGMRPLHKWAIAVGSVGILWCFFIMLAFGGSGPLTERGLERSFTNVLNENRQAIFDAIHPVGTAQSVTVHDVHVNWRRGEPSEAPNEAESVTITFTLHWEGPLTRNGYTKFYAVYDFDVDDFIHQELVATNGITNEDIEYAVGFALGIALQQAIGY